MTPLGIAVMRQDAPDFQMVFPDARSPKTSTRSTTSRRSKPTRGAAPADLLDQLKSIRRTLAHAADVPVFVVAPNRTLEVMAEERPTTSEAMLEIHGMGPSRLTRYGTPFLEAIRAWTGA